MKITVNARKVSVDETLRNQLEKKLSKFDRLFPENTEVSVKLSRIREKERAEVTIFEPPFIFRSEDENKTFLIAVDECIEKIDRQIRKNKTRLKKRLRDSITIPEDATDVTEEGEFRIRTKAFPIKPMTLDEAILNMNLLGHQFYVFKDVETEETCVVYKRRDGDYGVIVPE